MKKASANLQAPVSRVAFAFLSSRTLNEVLPYTSMPDTQYQALRRRAGYTSSDGRRVRSGWWTICGRSYRTFRRSASLCPTH